VTKLTAQAVTEFGQFATLEGQTTERNRMNPGPPPAKLANKIRRGDYVEMQDILPDMWLMRN